MKVNYLIKMKDLLTDPEDISSIGKLINNIIQPHISRKHAQNLLSQISSIIFKKFYSDFEAQDILLIPILRAGLAMWVQANNFFEMPETLFLICRKEKSTRHVISYPALQSDFSNKKIIILDTVAATGDTLLHVAQILAKPLLRISNGIQIVTCFSSPEAIKKLQDIPLIETFTTACLMETVDPYGYLVPSVGGDIGDKLFGHQYVPSKIR